MSSSGKPFVFPSREQRKNQINMLNYMEKERRDSKEFQFPDESFLHRRRPSGVDINSATQSEDDESVVFEVKDNLICKNYEFIPKIHVLDNA